MPCDRRISSWKVKTQHEKPSSRGHKPTNQWFRGASHFILDNPTMVDRQKIIQNSNEGKPLLDLLQEHMIPGVQIDSSARYPPPQCHPRTRISLQNSIKAWLLDETRSWNMLWLHGPAGVGKSAVAQSVGEACEESGILGAAFFFFRPNLRNDPNRVIPTLIYQFAVRFSTYRRTVARRLADDSLLLEKTPRIQFKRLLMEPLMDSKIPGKVVIILDGLDECDGEEAQRETIEMVNEVLTSLVVSPVLWIVCSRPEAHHKAMFLRADFKIDCWKVELLVNAEESRNDVRLYIEESFREIRAKYSDMIFGNWPLPEQVAAIVKAASGLFIFASTVIKFIGDPGYADPRSQLDAVMCVIQHSRISGNNNPMAALDLPYTRLFSDIPPHILPKTMHILGASIQKLPVIMNTSALSVANLLHMPLDTFYLALRKLHSVINIPDPEDAWKLPLRFFHASLADYLQDPLRSGIYCLSHERAWSAVAQSYLQDPLRSGKYCLSHERTWSAVAQSYLQYILRRGQSSVQSFPWPPPAWDRPTTMKIESHIWECILIWTPYACTAVGELEDRELFHQIRYLDFTTWGSYILTHGPYMSAFLNSHTSTGSDENIFQKFLEKLKCRGARPFDLEELFYGSLPDAIPYYVLLGYGRGTSLTVLHKVRVYFNQPGNEVDLDLDVDMGTPGSIASSGEEGSGLD